MNKQWTYLLVTLAALSITIFIGGLKEDALQDMVKWSENPLTWENFKEVDYVLDDFDAAILSEIQVPNRLENRQALIFAYMNPKESSRKTDSLLDEQLLKHEQYHFNLAEYTARLLRKELVELGESEISSSDLSALKSKYEVKLNGLQQDYDEESEHNIDYLRQRYWELKIDDLLRQTTYFKNPDLYSYSSFREFDTQFYRKIYISGNHEVLTSYPLNTAESKKGEVYKIEHLEDTVRVSFFKNGKVVSGGILESPITNIVRVNDSIFENHFLTEKGDVNADKKATIIRFVKAHDGTLNSSYFDKNGTQIEYKGIYKKSWVKAEDGSYYSSFYDKNDSEVKNHEGIWHQRKVNDEKGRRLSLEEFDQHHKPMFDLDFIHKRIYVYDKNNNLVRYSAFDKEGNYAKHVTGYHQSFEYDIQGYKNVAQNYNDKGARHNDKAGVARTEYFYDDLGNEVTTQRFNFRDEKTTGKNDTYQIARNYDSIGRLTFYAEYYPEYVLKFSEKRWAATQVNYLNDTVVLQVNKDAYDSAFPNDNDVQIIKEIRNEKNEILREYYFKDSIHFSATPNGIHFYENTYDSNGNTIEQIARDSIGNYVAYDKDVVLTRWSYNEDNIKIETRYYKDSIHLAETSSGVAYNRFAYDDKGNFIERTNLDKNGNPKNLNGVYREEYIVNKLGQDSIINKYDYRNRPIRGVSKTVYTYNDFGNQNSESYFDAQGRAAIDNDGVHMKKLTYDKHQNYTGHTNFNRRGNPINNAQGFHKWTQRYYESGYLSDIIYQNVDDELVIGPEGYAKETYSRNDADEVVRVVTYGADNEMIADMSGIADYVYTRFPSSMLSKISYYDENGELKEDFLGFAEYRYSENLNGLYYDETGIDAEGNEAIDEEDAEDTETTEDIEDSENNSNDEDKDDDKIERLDYE